MMPDPSDTQPEDTTLHPRAQPPRVGRFAYIETSDAAPGGSRGAGEGLSVMTVVAPTLGHDGRGGRGDVTYWVPRGCAGEADLPVVVLLHGVYGSHWAWAGKAGAHLTAQRLMDAGEIGPCVLAMPGDGLVGEGSGYVDHPGGPRVAQWIADDVPDALRAAVPQVGAGSVFFIAGLSMGGFGAMRLGATRPDRFAAFAGMSSLTHLRQMAWCTHDATRFDGWDTAEASLIETLTRERGRHGPFRFDCGRDDYLIGENRELHAQLDAAGVLHTYEEFAGEHTWDYWRDHLADALRFFDSHLPRNEDTAHAD